jgi:hypothetical protein
VVLALAFAAMIVAAPLLIGGLADVYDLRRLAVPARAAAVSGAVLACIALVCLRWRRVGALIAAIALIALPVFYLVYAGVAIASDLRSSKQIGQVLAERLRSEDLVVMQAPPDNEYENVAGLRFYAGHKVWLLKLPSTPSLYLPPPPEERFFIDVSTLSAIWRSPHRVFLVGTAAFIRSLPVTPVYWDTQHGDVWMTSNIDGPGAPTGPHDHRRADDTGRRVWSTSDE